MVHSRPLFFFSFVLSVQFVVTKKDVFAQVGIRTEDLCCFYATTLPTEPETVRLVLVHYLALRTTCFLTLTSKIDGIKFHRF